MSMDGKRELPAVMLESMVVRIPEGASIPAPDMGPLRFYDEDGREVKPGEPLVDGRRYVLATADVTATP